MSRNGSGTYTLPAGNPVVTGTTISTTWANNTLNDIAATLTDSVAADGQTPMTGDLDLNSNKIVNLAPAAFAGDAVEYSQFVAATTVVAITGGTINGTTIGETTRSSGKFTTLSANSTLGVTGATTLSSTLDVTGAATFTANSAFNGTGALKIPAGTTGQQPTPVTGMLRYNSTSNLFEGYSASAWTNLGGGAAGSNTQVQFNNSGLLAGSSALTFNGTTLATTTLQSTNISDGTNTTSTTNCVRGSAKAFVNFAGTATPPIIRNAYNVSSVTKNATGDFTVAFTNTFAAAPDAYTLALSLDSLNLTGAPVCTVRDGTMSASSFSLATGNIAAAQNPVYVFATAFA
jgi:hypothetical protein